MRLPELDGRRAGRARSAGSLRRLPGLVARRAPRPRARSCAPIYREYAGAELDDLDAIVDEFLTDARARRGSRRPPYAGSASTARPGTATVLITGAIRPLTRPLAPLFDDIVAAELAVDDRGRCTGFLAASPLVGESRAAWMRRCARRERHRPGRVLRLRRQPLRPADAARRSGNPVAVRPDVSLFRARPPARWHDRRLARPRGDRAAPSNPAG